MAAERVAAMFHVCDVQAHQSLAYCEYVESSQSRVCNIIRSVAVAVYGPGPQRRTTALDTNGNSSGSCDTRRVSVLDCTVTRIAAARTWRRTSSLRQRARTAQRRFSCLSPCLIGACAVRIAEEAILLVPGHAGCAAAAQSTHFLWTVERRCEPSLLKIVAPSRSCEQAVEKLGAHRI